MKRIVIFIFLSGLSFTTYSQEIETDAPRRMHIGLHTGLNNFNGFLGTSLEYLISDPVSAYAGVGLSSWGIKFGGGARYYFNYPRQFAVNLGFSHALGYNNLQTKLETTTGTEDVILDLRSASALNLSALYFFKMGKKNRLNIEFGYAIPLNLRPYNTKGNVVLTRVSERALNLIQPGGFTIGLGFTFGL